MRTRFFGARQESVGERCLVRSSCEQSLHLVFEFCDGCGTLSHCVAELFVDGALDDDFHGAEDVDFVGGESRAVAVAAALLAAFPVAV